MITREDLSEFFDVGDQDSLEKAKELNEMSIADKVAARKAIIDLRIDPDYKKSTDDGQIRLLHVKENLSEFKDGETVALCVQKSGTEIAECNIGLFRENGDIEIIINSYNFTSSIDEYGKEPLMLIKKEVSMSTFYQNFCFKNEFFEKDYFENHLINKKQTPSIPSYGLADIENNRTFIQDSWGCDLNEAQHEALIKAEKTKDYYLIQGPPGSGKSFITAIRLLDEILAGHKVVVIGPTHMAVNNVLIKTAELMDKLYEGLAKNTIIKCGQSYNAKTLYYTKANGERAKITNAQYLNTYFLNEWKDENTGEKIPLGFVIGMTPYSLQSKRARGLEFDTLFIDEAGQLTIPIAWMAMVKNHKVILAGDHKQLPPIVSEKVKKEELKHSIFEHLVRADNCTMLNISFRMNGVICDLVSDLFYESKLKPFNATKRLRCNLSEQLYSGSVPVVLNNCEENGRQISNAETNAAIEIITKYVSAGIPPQEIAVLAPFRAQCANLRKRLAQENDLTSEQRQQIVIDTVERMQGQEREIIIYSFTAGEVGYMTEMSDFLYSPNKLNVAFSRAKNKLILLGNVKSLRKIHNELIDQILQHPSVKIIGE